MNFLETCHLDKIFSNITIKHRIWFGFGLVLAILLFISLSTLSQFVSLSNGISNLTEEIQPVVLNAQNLETELEATSRVLGFYLLTREKSYGDEYFEHLVTAKNLVNQLSQLHFVAQNKQHSTTVANIETDLIKLDSYKNTMVELVKDVMKNIPAQQMASSKLNPMAQELQVLIGQMIDSDFEEDNADSSRDNYRKAIFDLRYYNAQIASELRTYLAFRNQVNLDNMALIIEVSRKKLKVLGDSEDMYTFEQSDIMKQFISLNKTYFKELDVAIAIHSTDKYRTDIYLIKTKIAPLVSKIATDLGNLVNDLKETITDNSNQLQSEASGASNKIIIGMSIGIFCGIIIAFLMARMITMPINQAVHAMHDLSEGEGDLTQRLSENGKSEVALMGKSFNNFAGKVQSVISELANSVESLSTVVGDVSNIVDDTQSGAQQQRQQTEQVATAVTEMTATIQEVATNANLAADSAQMADKSAKFGQSVVEETVSAINSLASEIETSVDVINKLSKDTLSIGTVLDVIKGIAEQTNLLALNAAIEAARAGEQGRGFAVVADEVRTLASRTQASTTEIETMIEHLQVQAHAAVETINQGQAKAHASVEKASNAGDALKEIANSVATISSMNIQIATASEEQSAVSEEINQNVVNISQVADSNAQSANQLSQSSEKLAGLSIELQKLVSQFKY